MRFDPQKHPFDEALGRHTRYEIESAQWLLSKSWPASVVSADGTNTIVTVKIEIEQPNYTFPLITCPVYGPQYIRWPIKPGDKGVMFCADYGIGAMSGLGTGVAKMAPVGSLGAGVFFPVGNTDFIETPNPNATVIYGPDGVIIKATEGDTRVSVDAKGNVVIYGAKSITTDCFGYGTQVTFKNGTWEVKNYTQGITPTNLPPIPPQIPPVED